MQGLPLDLAQRLNQTCVLVSHDVEEAVYMANGVLALGPRPTKVVREVRLICQCRATSWLFARTRHFCMPASRDGADSHHADGDGMTYAALAERFRALICCSQCRLPHPRRWRCSCWNLAPSFMLL